MRRPGWTPGQGPRFIACAPPFSWDSENHCARGGWGPNPFPPERSRVVPNPAFRLKVVYVRPRRQRMSLKRSHTSSKSAFGGGDAGAKVDRQELYDELKRMAAANETFTPVDVALAIGAGEPQVSKALLGLAAEGYLEKVEVGK